MSVTSTTAANNAIVGFYQNSAGHRTVETSVATGNRTACTWRPTGIVRASNSVFSSNHRELRNVSGGTLQSRGNNLVRGNTIEMSGTITPASGL